MRKWRYRAVKPLGQHDTASKWQSLDLNPCSLALEPIKFLPSVLLFPAQRLASSFC